MKLRYLLYTILLLLGFGALLLTQDFPKSPSTLFFNGDLLTMEDGNMSGDALLIEGGKIKAIGTSKDLQKLVTSETRRIDLQGATLMPGFIDPHTHPAISAFFADMEDLSGFTHKTNIEVWSHLKEKVKTYEAGEWILAKGLDPVLTPDLVTPTRQFLDSLIPQNPVFIVSQSIHSYWANSAAFEAVGIDKDTPNPSTSSFYEKDANGELTGFIAEQEALIPFRQKITEIQGSRLQSLSVETLDRYAANGNTTIVAMGLTAYDQKVLDFYKYLSASKPNYLFQVLAFFKILPIRKSRVRHFIYLRFDATSLLPESSNNGDDQFKILGVKFWYDGAPYTGSMYMEEPYLLNEFNSKKLHIAHNHKGEALMSPQELSKAVTKYIEAGWQIAVHSQGDQSTKEVLEAFGNIKQSGDPRHRLEHCLMIKPSSLQKMKSLNISPSFHINHLYYYGKALAENIIGKERAEKMLPVQFADSIGHIFTLHSDAPMFPSEPLSLVQTAVTRLTKEGSYLGQDEAISIYNGLKALTINAAWQIKMEDKLGSLKVGKYADLVVLDRNPLKTPAENLREIHVLRTVVAGQDVYVAE